MMARGGFCLGQNSLILLRLASYCTPYCTSAILTYTHGTGCTVRYAPLPCPILRTSSRTHNSETIKRGSGRPEESIESMRFLGPNFTACSKSETAHWHNGVNNLHCSVWVNQGPGPGPGPEPESSWHGSPGPACQPSFFSLPARFLR